MMSQTERIEIELERISQYFQDLPENELAMVEPLLQNAAFMRIALEDLQDQISRDGVVETYRNSETQYGLKQSAALQAFNSTIKNYAAVIKTLSQMLPKTMRPATMAIAAWKPKEPTDAEIREKRIAELKHDMELRHSLREASHQQHAKWKEENRDPDKWSEWDAEEEHYRAIDEKLDADVLAKIAALEAENETDDDHDDEPNIDEYLLAQAAAKKKTEDYEARKRRGELTPEELEHERQAEESRARFREIMNRSASMTSDPTESGT